MASVADVKPTILEVQAVDMGQKRSEERKVGGGDFYMSFAGDGAFPMEYTESQKERLQKAAEHYKFGKLMGRNGFTTVFRVKDKLTSKELALKEVIVPEEHTVTDLETEVANAKAFEHPNLLKLHASHNNGRIYHLVYDLCTGGNLSDYVQKYTAEGFELDPPRKGGLSFMLMKKYVPQMLSAVLYLHQEGFIHRNIKPNKFLRVDKHSEHVKLCDFRMCIRIGKEEKLTKVCGTPGFMAPEVKFAKSYDRKADVFSLATTIFYLASNVQPPEANFDSVKEYVEALKSCLSSTQTWQNADPEIVGLVMRMLAVDPKHRPSIKEVIMSKDWVRTYVADFDRPRSSYKGCSVM